MVTIDFGGKTRTLKFGLRACQELEQKLSVDGMTRVGSMLSQASVTAAVACLLVGLKEDDQALTSNLVTKYLEEYVSASDGRTFVDLSNDIWRALEETGLFVVDRKEGGEQGNRTGA